MNNIDYELSMWDNLDKFIISVGGQDRIVDTLYGINYSYTLINEYTEEIKIATISNSNSFLSPLNAFNIKLTQNINGTNELEFSVPYKYYREEDDLMAINPYINYLIPGRQLKLRYDYERDSGGTFIYVNGEKLPIWYDLVIKTTSEVLDDNSINYTASDSHIDELSRNGYSIELDTELENNMGSVTGLATLVLEDIDWTVADAETSITLPSGQLLKSDRIKSTNNEVLYKYTIPDVEGFDATVMDDYEYNGQTWTKGATIHLEAGNTVYISSSCYLNQRTPQVFLYSSTSYVTDSDGTILNSPNWSAALPINYTTDKLYVDSRYRGNMLSMAPITKYVAVVGAACAEYLRQEEYYQIDKTVITKPARGTPYFTKNSGHYDYFTGTDWDVSTTYYTTRILQTPQIAEEDKTTTKYYSYDTIFYPTTASIQEVLGTQTNFSSNSGWEQTKVSKKTVDVAVSGGTSAISVLEIDFSINNSTAVPPSPTGYCWNNAINGCKTLLSKDGSQLLTKGESYIVAILTQNATESNITGVTLRGINSNTSEQSLVTLGDCTVITDATRPYCPELDGYKLFRVTINQNVNYEDGITYWKLYTYFQGSNGATKTLLKYCTMFKEAYTKTTVDGVEYNQLVVPNIGKATADLVKTKHNIFRQDYKEFMPFAVNIKTLIFLDTCYADEISDSNHLYVLVKNSNYEKITSITASQSNYYNIILSLCETFECWSKYITSHTSDGKIIYKYEHTSDSVPLSGKRYYRLRNNSPSQVYFNDAEYSVLKMSDFFKVNTDSAYNPALTYYTYLQSSDLFIEANLGYQWIGFLTNYYTRRYEPTTKVTYFHHCEADEAYSATTLYYTYIIGELTAVSVKNNFNSATYNNFWLVDSTKFNSNIIYEKKYLKFVAFKQYCGRYNDAGFRYGINLNGIKRDVVGDAICTKLYVPSINTDLNADGLCTILKADSNYCGETAIYNFQYYIHNGLVDEINFNRDLYGDATGGIAYLTKLHDWNADANKKTEELVQIALTLNLYTSSYNTNQAAYESALSAQNDAISKIMSACKISDWTTAMNRKKQSTDNDQIKSYIDERDEATAQVNSYSGWLDTDKARMEDYLIKYNNLAANLADTTSKKLVVMNEFYRKYSSLLKEGTWSALDYFDNNMYYSDALKIAATSAFPQIKYELNAAEISLIDGYSAYNFLVGDKTYIEDIEFFGYNTANNKPYQEEVIVSVITKCLDNPLENSITILNYKTLFQDLFQRVSASVLSYESNKNAYLVAATTIADTTSGGALIQKILNTNNTTIKNAAQQTVTIDEKGLTITDDVAPSMQLRGIGKGIYITDDGGENWTAGITASGINATAINAGSVNTAKITIMDGKFPAFLWNSGGIYAYAQYNNVISQTDFVRFDENGLYGCKGDSVLSSEHPTITDVKERAPFAITWDGFFLRDTEDNNWISIGSIDVNESDYKPTDFLLYTGTAGTLPLPATIDHLYYEYDANNPPSNHVKSQYLTGSSWSGTPALYILVPLNRALHRVISAGTFVEGSTTQKNLNFALYEDGSIMAKDGDFRGTIYSNGLIDAATGRNIFNSQGKIASDYVTTTACFG